MCKTTGRRRGRVTVKRVPRTSQYGGSQFFIHPSTADERFENVWSFELYNCMRGAETTSIFSPPQLYNILWAFHVCIPLYAVVLCTIGWETLQLIKNRPVHYNKPMTRTWKSTRFESTRVGRRTGTLQRIFFVHCSRHHDDNTAVLQRNDCSASFRGHTSPRRWRHAGIPLYRSAAPEDCAKSEKPWEMGGRRKWIHNNIGNIPIYLRSRRVNTL